MRRKTYILWKKRLARACAAFIILGIGYVYFHSGFFTIHSYKIIGAPVEYVDDLENGMQLIAEEKLYKVLPGNRIISFHNDDIRTLVQDTLPNTKNISIHPSGLHTLTIRLSSYTPLFAVSDTYAISSDGTIYKEITPLDGYVRISIASTTAVAPSTLVSVSKLIQNIDSVLFNIRSMDIDTYNDIRLYDPLKHSYILIAPSSNMEKVWSNILSAIDTDPLKSKLEKERANLEYIDARFGNKVFYKFTNSAAPAIIPEHDQVSTTTQR